jgi:tRNA(Ile)-lysidine synthase
MIQQPIEEDFRETIQRHALIKKGDHVVIGLSGGPDSVCLFHLLLSIRESKQLTLHPVHINHGFRPGAADEDQTYVEELTASHGIPCRSFVYDCNRIAMDEKISGEEAGRRVRYDSFALVADEIAETGVSKENIKIAVAHHLNDQVETVLFRLLRGTGTDGLAGMEYSRDNGAGIAVIRPLLDVKREDIEEYCQTHGLAPRTDLTNNQPLYTRNKIRLELIPYIKEHYNSNFEEAILRLCKIAGEDRTCLGKLAEIAFEDLLRNVEPFRCSLDAAGLRELDPSIRSRVLFKALESIGLPRGVGYVHMGQAEALLEEGKTSSQMNFPGGVIMEISYDTVELHMKAEDKEPKPNPPGLKARIFNIEDLVKKPNMAVFDLDLFLEEYAYLVDPLSMIVARSREPGDFIVLPGVGGRKRIQDFMVDLKVPKDLRDGIYIVAIGNEILWIPKGLTNARYTQNYKVQGETKKVLTLELDGGL